MVARSTCNDPSSRFTSVIVTAEPTLTAPEPEDAMEHRQIMSTASPASLWRKSSNAVSEAFHDRIQLLMPVAGRRDAFSIAMASFDAQIHLLNLMAAECFAREAFKRRFKEVELASSKEDATCAANAESMEMPASLPLRNFRHEIFAQRIAARCSATAAYAHAYGRPRDNVAAVRGGQLIRKVNIRERAVALKAENALASLPTIRKVLEGVEARTIERINNAQINNVLSPPIGLRSSWDR
jgi:hypothetical protein